MSGIFRSHTPDISIPDASLSDHVLARARRYGDKVAVIDHASGEQVTYAALARGASAIGAALADRGLGPGDVVALVSHNQPVFPVALYGILAAGATVTPINPVLTAEEIVKQLRASRARAIISSAAAAEKVREMAASLGIDHHLVMSEAGSPDPEFDAILASGRSAPEVRIDPSTMMAVLPFSSGTTGLPKGVLLTHRNLVANLVQMNAGWRVAADDVMSASLPFFHIYGFTVILNAGLAAGASLVTQARYHPTDFLELIQRHRVTRAFLAPPMVISLADSPDVDRFDLTSVRFAICGGAPLDGDLAARAQERLGFPIRQGYGMTEASPGTHLAPDVRFAGTPPGSVGELAASTQARLVEPLSGLDAAPGEPGELWIRGPQVMTGYLDDPAATAQTIVDGGWLRTGDIARIDENGCYWIVDRLKELIKYKGYQIAPAELEALMLSHPDVADVAVVGVPHRAGGEAPRAYVVVERELPADDLMTWVAERVAPYKKVREVVFVDAIPKSPSGKILRRLLRQLS